tara:strand:- start:12 stop:320 length:309 start_codon:yes stop_codon:yes gene_type:complete
MPDQQNHPLYQSDRDLLNRLLAKKSPEDSDLIDLARLLIRYEGFPGANDLQSDLHKVLNLWDMNQDSLNNRTREIWKNGFKIGNQSNDIVGSGFDTEDNQST